jgi:hypothetical protein
MFPGLFQRAHRSRPVGNRLSYEAMARVRVLSEAGECTGDMVMAAGGELGA